MADIASSALGGATAYTGTRVLVEGVIRLRGVPTDPSLLIFYSRSPSGVKSQTSFPDDTLTKRDVGLYEASVLVDEPGLWGFRWEAAGVVDAVGEVTLIVAPSSVS